MEFHNALIGFNGPFTFRNSRLARSEAPAWRSRAASGSGLLPLLLLLLILPAVAQAQWVYTNNGDATITITGYTGPGGGVTVPDTIDGLPVTSIGGHLAFGFSSVTNVIMGTNVTSIGPAAFDNCTSLASVSIGRNVTNIGDSAFYHCTSLTRVTIPDSVTIIGYGAFSYCGSLASVTIPDSVISIEGTAFIGCSSLISITIPNSITNIELSVFAYCTSLTNVTIANSVTSIGEQAFDGCSNLPSITIPDSVTSIGRNAFTGCTNLTSITVPESVTSIGDMAFWGCSSLTAIGVAPLNPAYDSVDGVLFNKGQSILIVYPGGKVGSYEIPSSVVDIHYYAFAGCASLTKVSIPNSVSSIGLWAFAGCSSLTGIMIPEGVISIGDGAFRECTRLESVTIPNSVTYIGFSPFEDCARLASITVDPLNPAYCSADGVVFTRERTMLLQCPGAKAGSYSVPNTVTTIAGGAFSGCANLINVTIPESVTTIGGAAFDGCSSLTNMTIPSRVTSIADNTFWDCTSLTSLMVGESVTNIGIWAFYNCTNLQAVYFWGDAPSLEAMNFYDATNATVYYLPGTTGWGAIYGGRPTALWVQAPTFQTPPQTQTAEAGSAVSLQVRASSPMPLLCLWYLNNTNLISRSTNGGLVLTGVQSSQSGAYTVVISNVLGAVTSAPALLNVIAPVERRPVPGVKVTGEAGSLLNVDYADSLDPAPSWTALASVSLTSTSQFCFDLTVPLLPQRFYRSWQAGTPGVRPPLDLHLVPAITLTGSIGRSVRVDAINQVGPIDAWFTLDTVAFSNQFQLYFDISAWKQPPRLYRLVQVP